MYMFFWPRIHIYIYYHIYILPNVARASVGDYMQFKFSERQHQERGENLRVLSAMDPATFSDKIRFDDMVPHQSQIR